MKFAELFERKKAKHKKAEVVSALPLSIGTAKGEMTVEAEDDWEPENTPEEMREIVLLPKSGRWEKNSLFTLTDTMKAAFGPKFMYRPADYSMLQRGGEGPITIFVGKDAKINYRALYDGGIKVSIQM